MFVYVQKLLIPNIYLICFVAWLKCIACCNQDLSVHSMCKVELEVYEAIIYISIKTKLQVETFTWWDDINTPRYI